MRGPDILSLRRHLPKNDPSGGGVEAAPSSRAGHSRRPPRATAQLSAYALFFPAATILAVAGPPLWIAVRLESLGALIPLNAAQHAHEMLLGFASAIMAGFLITKGGRPMILLTFCVWIAARLAAIGLIPWPATLGAIASLAFVGLLFVQAGLPFLRAARVGHNMVFAPILVVLLLTEAAYQIGGWSEAGAMRDRAMLVALDAIAAMMFAMGGRIIAGASAAELRRRAITVDHRAHLPLEWIGTLSIAVAAAGDASGWQRAAAWALGLAGAATTWRLLKWRPWRLLGQRELSLLALGYAWLSIGLLLPATGWLPRTEAAHALAIGALGTLGQVMMIRTVIQRRRLTQSFPAAAAISAAAISVAAILRLSVPVLGGDGLVAAASAWAASFLLFLAVLGRLLATRTSLGR